MMTAGRAECYHDSLDESPVVFPVVCVMWEKAGHKASVTPASHLSLSSS